MISLLICRNRKSYLQGAPKCLLPAPHLGIIHQFSTIPFKNELNRHKCSCWPWRCTLCFTLVSGTREPTRMSLREVVSWGLIHIIPEWYGLAFLRFFVHTCMGCKSFSYQAYVRSYVLSLWARALILERKLLIHEWRDQHPWLGHLFALLRNLKPPSYKHTPPSRSTFRSLRCRRVFTCCYAAALISVRVCAVSCAN